MKQRSRIEVRRATDSAKEVLGTLWEGRLRMRVNNSAPKEEMKAQRGTVAGQLSKGRIKLSAIEGRDFFGDVHLMIRWAEIDCAPRSRAIRDPRTVRLYATHTSSIVPLWLLPLQPILLSGPATSCFARHSLPFHDCPRP
jgi:hypothetical protein